MLRLIKILILIGVLVVVVGGGVSLALIKGWSPFGIPPQQILAESMDKMWTLERWRIKGNGKLEVKGKGEEETQGFQASLDFSSDVNITDLKNPKQSSKVNLTLGAEGMEFSLAGEVRVFGSDFYLKITRFPSLPFLGLPLENFKNQWIEFNREKLMEISGKKAEMPEVKEEMTEEIAQEIKSLLKGREILKIKNNLGKEELDGIQTYHYLNTLNREELKTLIPEFFQRMKKFIPQEDKSSYEEDLQKFLKDFPQKFDEFYDKIGEINLELWIGNDRWLRRIKIEKEIDLSHLMAREFQTPLAAGETQQVETPSEPEELKAIISIDLKFSDFNQKIEIERPQEFKSIEEILPPEILGSPSAVSSFTPSLPLGTLSPQEELSNLQTPTAEEIEEMEKLLKELEELQKEYENKE